MCADAHSDKSDEPIIGYSCHGQGGPQVKICMANTLNF